MEILEAAKWVLQQVPSLFRSSIEALLLAATSTGLCMIKTEDFGVFLSDFAKQL